MPVSLVSLTTLLLTSGLASNCPDRDLSRVIGRLASWDDLRNEAELITEAAQRLSVISNEAERDACVQLFSKSLSEGNRDALSRMIKIRRQSGQNLSFRALGKEIAKIIDSNVLREKVDNLREFQKDLPPDFARKVLSIRNENPSEFGRGEVAEILDNLLKPASLEERGRITEAIVEEAIGKLSRQAVHGWDTVGYILVLDHFGGPALVKVLEMIQSREVEVRSRGACVLGVLARTSREALNQAAFYSVRDPDPQVRERAADCLLVAEGLMPELRIATKDVWPLEKAEILLSDYLRELRSQANTCKGLCDVFNIPRETLELAARTPESREDGSDWSAALISLNLLFATKAAPYCEAAKRFVGEGGPALVGKLSAQVAESKGAFTPGVYAAAFTHLMGVESSGFVLGEVLPKNTAELQKRLVDGANNSLLSTFTTSVAAIAADSLPAETLDLFLHTKNACVQNPMAIPYGFIKTDGSWSVPSTSRSAAARNVPFYLALYRHDSTTTNKKAEYQDRLLDAIENFRAFMPDLMSQIARRGTHAGPDGLAPYYFFSSIPYVTGAIRLLLGNESLGGEKRERLIRSRDEIHERLMLAIQSDGLFVSQNRRQYPSSLGYVNALGGLALLPLLEECNGVKVESLGLIDGWR